MDDSEITAPENASPPMPSTRTDIWREADSDWEALQERAMEQVVVGRLDAAGVLWKDALTLAKVAFSNDDLRLATSLANHAFSLSQCGEHDSAEATYQDALRAWDAGAAGIDHMVVERRARSSAYHLRMEVKHWKSYEDMQRRQRKALGVEGRAAIVALRTGTPVERDGLSRWHREKPSGLSDYRKFLAAVLLVVDSSAIEARDRVRGE